MLCNILNSYMANPQSNSGAPSPVVPTMESAITSIVGRSLTDPERKMLMRLRDQYGYDDNDPLVVVLAMMGAYQIMTEEIPLKLAAAAKETIEVHQQTLRNQSMIVAKDLVGTIAGLIHASSRSLQNRTIDVLIGCGIGALVTVIIGVALKKFGIF